MPHSCSAHAPTQSPHKTVCPPRFAKSFNRFVQPATICWFSCRLAELYLTITWRQWRRWRCHTEHGFKLLFGPMLLPAALFHASFTKRQLVNSNRQGAGWSRDSNYAVRGTWNVVIPSYIHGTRVTSETTSFCRALIFERSRVVSAGFRIQPLDSSRRK